MLRTSFRKGRIAGVLLASTVMLAPVAGHAADNDILFILDGSGSMWGQIDGVAKIQTAKNTMSAMIDDLPASARIGLMTYGASDKSSCQDVKMLNPIGSDRAAVKKSITSLKPLGKTPIGQSLKNGIASLAGSQPADVPKSLVLISDGIETCNSNPCEIASTAQSAGVDMKVHVVGFNVDDKARAQLQCIAANGGGQYFDASNTAGFKDAMTKVVKAAQASIPDGKEKDAENATEVFRDDFDGEDLAEDWTVKGPNPDNFIVEEGMLTMLTTTQGGFGAAKPSNILTLSNKLPKGDWDAEVLFTGEYATKSDRLTLGLFKDSKNYLAASYQIRFNYANKCTASHLVLWKASRGKVDTVNAPYMSTDGFECKTYFGKVEPWERIQAAHQSSPIRLVLSKRGRQYNAKAEMIGAIGPDGKPALIETKEFKSLRSPGELSLVIEKIEKGAKGEVLFQIDSVTVSKVEKADKAE